MKDLQEELVHKISPGDILKVNPLEHFLNFPAAIFLILQGVDEREEVFSKSLSRAYLSQKNQADFSKKNIAAFNDGELLFIHAVSIQENIPGVAFLKLMTTTGKTFWTHFPFEYFDKDFDKDFQIIKADSKEIVPPALTSNSSNVII